MSRPLARSLTDKLDEEFPSLTPGPPKRAPQKQETGSAAAGSRQAAQSGQAAGQKNSPLSSVAQLEMFDVKSLESFTQTDLTAQDLGHAIASTIPFIPDPPYDAQDQPSSGTDAANGFPQSPNMKLLRPEFFKRYDVDTLFFIFFYSPGTPQQFFAGQELKRRDWMFNTKYKTWFHRLAPTEKTATYEIGKFEYFDHGKESWGIMQMTQTFKFEYENLGE